MKSIFPRIITLVVVLCLLSGCAATGGAPDSSSTTDDAEQTKAEGTALGALLGGLVGAATGAAVDSKNRGRGAAIGLGIGAVGGGVAGNMYGKNAAQRKQQYANEEDRLDEEITALKGYNDELDTRNTECYTKIQELKRRVRNLHVQSQALGNQTYLSTDELQALLKTIQTNEVDITSYNEELDTLSEYKEELREKGSQSHTHIASLEKEINLLRNHINTLDSNNKQMAKLAENLSVKK